MDGTTALASVATAAAGGGRSFNMVFMDNIMKKMHGQERGSEEHAVEGLSFAV